MGAGKRLALKTRPRCAGGDQPGDFGDWTLIQRILNAVF